MTETKNILLIGGTGGGKSTLANVITNTNDFKEGKLGISETKEIQTKEFKNDNFDYLIIDNPGIGDTKLPTEKTLDTIAEAVYLVKNGVSRVFFVTDGRFDTNEMATYNLLRAVIFDKDVTKNTTIIRTRFKDFKKSKKREEDIKAMIDQGGELAEIIKSCEKRVIHVSNPSIEIEGADKEETELNKKARNKSREILLNHLSENCQTNSYKPPKLQALSDEIAGYMEGKKKLEEDLKSISKKKIRKLRNKKINDARVKGKDAKDSTENISKESEATAKQEKEQINDSQSSHSPDKKNNVEEEIKNLEEERKKLKEKIEEKENIIRQKVFKHIFNNYGDIEKVLGSDAIFISSVIGDDKNDWKKISAEFADKELVLKWRGQGFNYRQTQEWARVLENNFNPEYDAGFCAWLRDNKQLTAEKTLHNNDVNIEQLKSEYHHQLQSDNRELEIKLNLKDKQNWQLLNIIKHLQENFPNWTSGNPQIDSFIQECQLKASSYSEILEWIAYEDFSNIEYLAEGGFSKIYKARWDNGPIRDRNIESNNWKREGSREVILKSLHNSQDNTDFLQEIACHKLFTDKDSQVVNCWGISQDLQTGNYFMVIDYMPEGNLRNYLSKKNRLLDFEDRLYRLYTIAFGLEAIHEKGLVHHDFHSGNILVDGVECYITDLGLSRPVDEVNKEKKIFGVLPYVAPEILLEQPYTQKSDIYSFGIVAYEILTGINYFDELREKTSTNLVRLGTKICQGQRPQFNIKIPRLLEDLIKRCWDANPENRETAWEISKILGDRYNEMEDKSSKFYQQVQEAEEYNKTLPDEIKFPDYRAPPTYHSKHLPTKEITQLLKTLQLEDFKQVDLELEIPNEETEQQAQIQIPPK